MPVDPAHDAVLSRFQWQQGHADVWRVFTHAESLAATIEGLAAPWRGLLISQVVGIEARGFLLGAATAVALEAGFVAVRKDGTGLLPGPKVKMVADEDYRGHRHQLRMQKVLGPGDRVLLVDDWAERGNQALAAKRLVAMCGAEFAGVSLMVDQLPNRIRAQLGRVTAIITADELGSSAW